MRCTGVILAGGGATRYGGRPKGLERVGGRRIIDRVADALRETTDELLLVANAPRAAEWLPGVRTEADVRPGEGALGGLHAALSHAGGAILLVAWDMPFVPTALLRALRERGEADGEAGVVGGTPRDTAGTRAARADAVLPASDGSRRGVEPLCAWYSHACLGPIEAALDAGDRRVVAFHDHVTAVTLPLADVARFGDPSVMFGNVNSPEDLARAEGTESSRG